MNRWLPVSCVCALSLVVGACQSMPDIQSRLNSLDFNLDSSTYVARAGESLETIAFRYSTTVAQLQRLNPHAANGVYSGMHLNIREPVGTSVQTIRNARWSEADDNANRTVVQAAPVQRRQAVPIPAIATDQYLLGRERFNTTVRPAQIPAIVEQSSTGFAEQPGYPVEEVIVDENFVLPNTVNSVGNEPEPFVGGWQWPLEGQLARDYDPQRPRGRGIEIVGMPGQVVYATRKGVVDWVARSPDGVGKVVIVRHDDDYLSIYSNAQDLYVSMKDVVAQGDAIASLGANANDEPLLRFEISKNGNLLNPMDFLSPR